MSAPWRQQPRKRRRIFATQIRYRLRGPWLPTRNYSAVPHEYGSLRARCGVFFFFHQDICLGTSCWTIFGCVALTSSADVFGPHIRSVISTLYMVRPQKYSPFLIFVPVLPKLVRGPIFVAHSLYIVPF